MYEKGCRTLCCLNDIICTKEFQLLSSNNQAIERGGICVTGDGTKCSATAAVDQLESAYAAEATQGPLLCDIKYPQIAPGFVYDPTGSIQQDAFKNGKQVIPPLDYSDPVGVCFCLSHPVEVGIVWLGKPSKPCERPLKE